MTGNPKTQERFRRKKQQKRTNVFVMIIGAAFILVAVLMVPWIKQGLGISNQLVQPNMNHRPDQNGSSMGDPNAPVILEEYSDFTCAHCRIFARTIEAEITRKYVATGQVYYVFNSVGNILGHPNAVNSAEAAYCAGDQNMFWEYHDLLFENQTILFSNINRKLDKSLIEMAGFLALDTDRFKTCLDQGKFIGEIQKDQAEAFRVGIVETPSVVINGELFDGNWEDGDLVKAIEAALGEVNP